MSELCKCWFVVTDKYYICFVITWVTVLKVELDENKVNITIWVKH